MFQRIIKYITLNPALSIIILIGLSLRVILFINIEGRPDRYLSPDSHEYFNLSYNMMDHGLYSTNLNPPFKPETLRPPFYPLIIGFFNRIIPFPIEFVLILQIAANLILAVLCYSLMSRFISTKTGVVLAVFLLFEGGGIIHSCLLLTETFYTLILAGGIYLLVIFSHTGRYKTLIFAVALISISSYLRITSTLLIFCIILILLLLRDINLKRKIWGVVLTVIVFIIIISPWVIRNYVKYNLLAFSSGANYALYYHRAAGVISEITGKGLEETQRDFVKRTMQETGEYRSEYISRPFSGFLDGYNFRKAIKIISEHPLIFLKTQIYGTARLMLSPGVGVFTNIAGFRNISLGDILSEGNPIKYFKHPGRKEIFILIYLFFQMIILLLLYTSFFAGVIKLIVLSRSSNMTIILGIVLLFFLVILSGPEGHSRFRVPLMPYISYFSAYGLTGFFKRNRKE